MKSTDAAPPLMDPPADGREVASAGSPFLVHKRIAVLGANGVGKSALCIRVCLHRFEPKYMQTFQDVYPWTPTVNGVHYDVSIEDSDGQDANADFAIRNTTGVDGYVLVFSVCDVYSFQVIKAINDKLLDTLNVMQRTGTSEIPRVLVGNQVDIADEREVSSEEAERWANDNAIPYIETSAYTPYNAEQAFETVLAIIKKNLDDSHNPPPVSAATGSPSPPAPPKNQTCSVQ